MKNLFPLPLSLSLCVSAGGREGHPVFKWEASFVQEAGRALGARTGEGECHSALMFCSSSLRLDGRSDGVNEQMKKRLSGHLSHPGLSLLPV